MFDNVVDVDSGNDNEVAFARMLDVGIIAGTQEFPRQKHPEDVANRLLIFTGTAIFVIGKDVQLNRPTIRVRLRYPLTPSVKYVGSATVAALASIHGTADEDSVFAADGAETVVGPTGGRPIPDHNLPQNELYVLIDAGMLGENATLSRVAYQANVLMLDTEPDLGSITVRAAGTGGQFGSEATLYNGDKWEYLLTLTGPAPGGPQDVFTITLQSDDPQHAPIDPLHVINQLHGGQISGGSGVTAPVLGEKAIWRTVTITATGKKVSKTAKLNIGPLIV